MNSAGTNVISLRDRAAFEIGKALAQEDLEAGRDAASDDEICEILEFLALDAEVTGWAREACLRGYRAAFEAKS